MDTLLRMTAVAALLSSLGVMPAYAGLGQIKVLSAAGEPFEAEIPVVDEPIDSNALIGLADRNHYPLLSPYSPSVGRLQFSLVRQPDGTLSKVHVTGPASFDESTLHFAVEISWSSGRLVREFDVDYRREGPRQPKHRPLPDDESKKTAVSTDHHARLTPLGLGELVVRSSIGQPLLAEVEVLGRPPVVDPEQLSAVVLPHGAKGAGQAQLVASIHHEFMKSPDGKLLLRLYSENHVEEPVLALRLEVGIGRVRLARNYSLLFSAADKAGREADLPAAKEAASRGGGDDKVYRVVPGDTLSAIARRTTSGLTADQVARKLFAANPRAFIAGDRNKLKAGVRLAYPAQWQIAGVLTGKVPEASHRADSPLSAAAPVARAAKEGNQVAALPAASQADAREAQMKRRLLEQDQLLASAEQRLNALQQRLNTLQNATAHPATTDHLLVKDVPPPAVRSPSSAAAGHSGQVGDDMAPYQYGAGVAGGAVLLGAAWWWQRRRRRHVGAAGLTHSVPEGAAPSLLTMGPLTTLMGGSKPEGIDLSPVDLVAEAEVYLAYGRTDQALTLLREGLAREPMRQDLRFKLLEALAAQPDKQPFLLEATAAKGIFGKDSTLWQRVCELGRGAFPGNPLFEMSPEPLAEGSVGAAMAKPLVAQPSRSDSHAGILSRDATSDQRPAVAPSVTPEEVVMAGYAEPPAGEDKRELARLYLEMGDNETAQALLKETEDSA